jgi:hypothetical protein
LLKRAFLSILLKTSLPAEAAVTDKDSSDGTEFMIRRGLGRPTSMAAKMPALQNAAA